MRAWCLGRFQNVGNIGAHEGGRHSVARQPAPGKQSIVGQVSIAKAALPQPFRIDVSASLREYLDDIAGSIAAPT